MRVQSFIYGSFSLMLAGLVFALTFKGWLNFYLGCMTIPVWLGFGYLSFKKFIELSKGGE